MELNEQLADNFIRVGSDFIDLCQKEQLIDENLDFCETRIEKLFCGTVACHGGWGYFLYVAEEMAETHDFVTGADAIAEQLGFGDSDEFELWASDHSELWGNEYGLKMFGMCGHRAFGYGEGECTLEIIGKHYVKVGARIKVQLLEGNK